MPGLAMVELYISFYHKFITGNIDKAYDTYKELLPYIVALGQDNEIFVSLEKKVLMKKGFLSNSVCREPNRIPDETTVGILMKCLKKIL